MPQESLLRIRDRFAERLARFMADYREPILAAWCAHVWQMPVVKRVRPRPSRQWLRRALERFYDQFGAYLPDPNNQAAFDTIGELAERGRRYGFEAADLGLALIYLKRVLIQRIVDENRDEAWCVRDLCDLAEAGIDVFRLAVSDAYHQEHLKELRASEEKYAALLAGAGDGIFVLHPEDLTIVECNPAAQQMTGCAAHELIDICYLDLFRDTSRAQIRQHHADLHRDHAPAVCEVDMVTRNGDTVSVSVNARRVEFGDETVVLSIVRDIRERRQLTEHLRQYADELEARVARRTEKLRQSETEYRVLFEDQRKRSAQLALINEVGQRMLESFNLQELLDVVAENLQRRFAFMDVGIYLIDEETQEIHLRAHAGEYRRAVTVDFRQRVGEGVLGTAAARRQVVIWTPTRRDDSYSRLVAFPDELQSGSELAVPVYSERGVTGVIDVQSREQDAFDLTDISALQTLASQLAVAIDKVRLRDFSYRVLENMPASLAVLNRHGRTLIVNEPFLAYSHQRWEDCVGKHFAEAFDPALCEEADLARYIDEVLREQKTIEIPELRHILPDHSDRFLHLSISSVVLDDQPLVLIVITDVTTRARRNFQLQLMHQVGDALQASLDLDSRLHAILTCVTAGPALGFNRAFLMLASDDGEFLETRFAVGPVDHEEAERIWRELGSMSVTLSELLQRERRRQGDANSLENRVRGTRLDPASDHECALMTAIRNHELAVLHAPHCEACAAVLFRNVTVPNEFAVAPLVADEAIVGVLLADNLFSNAPTSHDNLQLLGTLAAQFAIAISNAKAHQQAALRARELAFVNQKLVATKDQILRHERLATIGEMAARLSHEIRNPLSTIGGMARSILKHPEREERVQRYARIMAEQVAKLEEIVTNMLTLSRPVESVKSPEELAPILERACLLARDHVHDIDADVVRRLPEEPLFVMGNARQLEQAFQNIVQNALQVIDDDGQVTVRVTGESDEEVRVDIEDTGPGVPQSLLDQIFEPFFTTRMSGSGLGLPTTKKIIEEHGGRIEVTSQEGDGTMFTVYLPRAVGEAADDDAENRSGSGG